MGSNTTFERIFLTSINAIALRDWVTIVQGFLDWNRSADFDEYLRLRSDGPNARCLRVRAWEVEGLRAKLTETQDAAKCTWEATEGCRSTRWSRLVNDQTSTASVDFYPDTGLAPLATWSFTDPNTAADFRPPAWVISEITAEYRILSRSFAI